MDIPSLQVSSLVSSTKVLLNNQKPVDFQGIAN
jgi:hypothetical protein